MASIAAALAVSSPRSLSNSRASFTSISQFKRAMSLPFKCWSGPSPEFDPEVHDKSSLLGISSSSWCAGLGALGFLETSYLTVLKLTGSEAFCPVTGGSCSDVLNSDYSFVFGVPLSLIGMVAYGLVALLGLQQTGKNLLSGLDDNNVRLILLGITTSMATSSAYFLYILSTKLSGASCLYCLISAILSFSLFAITMKNFNLDEIRKVAGLQIIIGGIVLTAVSNSYMMATSQLSGSSDITLEPYETEITTKSTSFSLALAKHLHSVGAKMYGAFWCSHCIEQKQMFGHEAAEILDYVECFPDGAGKGRKIFKECAIDGITGFPTWIIKDKVLSGEQELEALAEASGFVLDDFRPS